MRVILVDDNIKFISTQNFFGKAEHIGMSHLQRAKVAMGIDNIDDDQLECHCSGVSRVIAIPP